MRALSFVLALLAGCAANPAPRGALPSPEELETTARGGYILIKHRNGARTEGELLAANPEEVWVWTARGAKAVPVSQVESMRMAIYQTGQEAMTLWGTLGTISTISHGFFLIFTVPLWVTTTAISGGVESRRALLDYPELPVTRFATWARYPQGMPRVPSFTEPPPVPKPPP